MPKALHRVFDLIGQRGAALLNIGVIWALIGVVRGLNPPARSAEQEVGLLHYAIPHWWAVWLTAGLVAVVAAFWRHPSRDQWGFAALCVPPFVQAVSYGWSGLVWLVSVGELGYHLGVVYAIGWTFIALLPYNIAGWAEPAEPNGEA